MDKLRAGWVLREAEDEDQPRLSKSIPAIIIYASRSSLLGMKVQTWSWGNFTWYSLIKPWDSISALILLFPLIWMNFISIPVSRIIVAVAKRGAVCRGWEVWREPKAPTESRLSVWISNHFGGFKKLATKWTVYKIANISRKKEVDSNHWRWRFDTVDESISWINKC